MNISGKELSTRLKQFLELNQPFPVKYGYSRGVREGKCMVSYQSMGTSLNYGIGNEMISGRKTFLVTVQSEVAEMNMLCSDFIENGIEGKNIRFISDNLRKDVTVKNGWINSIILEVYNGLEGEVTYTADQVREILQKVADNYIFVTSQFDKTVDTSFIDELVVPELQDRTYSYSEMLQLKQNHLDKLLLASTQF